MLGDKWNLKEPRSLEEGCTELNLRALIQQCCLAGVGAIGTHERFPRDELQGLLEPASLKQGGNSLLPRATGIFMTSFRAIKNSQVKK